MAKQLYGLSDAEWARLEPPLPRGPHRVDDRRVISGMLHMLRSGARWRDCPAEYGPHTTIYNRFNRWSRQGVWLAMFEAVTGQAAVIGTAVCATSRAIVRRVSRMPFSASSSCRTTSALPA